MQSANYSLQETMGQMTWFLQRTDEVGRDTGRGSETFKLKEISQCERMALTLIHILKNKR